MVGEDQERVVAATSAAHSAMVEALAELDSDGGMSLDEVEVASVIATLAVMATRQMGLHPTWIIAMVAEGLLDADNPVPDVAEVQIRGVVS